MDTYLIEIKSLLGIKFHCLLIMLSKLCGIGSLRITHGLLELVNYQDGLSEIDLTLTLAFLSGEHSAIVIASILYKHKFFKVPSQ